MIRGLAWMTGFVLAYVMPGPSIIRHLTDRRDALQLFNLRIDGSGSFSGASVREAGPVLGLPTDRPELQVDATLYLKLPLRCRVDLSSAEGGKQVAQVIANGKKRAEGQELTALSAGLSEACTLLAQRSSSEGEARSALERHLKQLGIKEDATSLARFHGQVAFVMGDPGEDKPQLWLYKDDFMPARARFTDGSGTWDLQMLDYTSPATGEWFPRTLEVYKGGELQFRFTALKADTRAQIPDKLF